MRLNIIRSQEQKKGMLGGNKGVNFKLSCHLDISNTEENLIDYYNARQFTLLWKDTQEGKAPLLDVSQLINKRSFTGDTLNYVVTLEKDIIDACQSFKQLLMDMQNYGGIETVNIELSPDNDHSIDPLE